ncbi:9192_t:CDS:2, partial [Racocetra fulgida]
TTHIRNGATILCEVSQLANDWYTIYKIGHNLRQNGFPIVSAKTPSRRDTEKLFNSLISPRAAYLSHPRRSPLELQTEPE